MGFFHLAEQEFFLNIAAGEPHRVGVYTTWPYYTVRVDRSEGFTATNDFQPEEGGRCLQGVIDISEYNFIHLRKRFGSEELERQFEAEKAKLGPVKVLESEFAHESGERETLFHAQAEERYWLKVQTDAAVWLRRMDQHPYAVPVEELRFGREEDSVMRTYLLPRQLLTIRRNRPQYTDEYRQQLRDRLLNMRAA